MSASSSCSIVLHVPLVLCRFDNCNALIAFAVTFRHFSFPELLCEFTQHVVCAQANEQLQVVRESHAATSKEVGDAHR